MIAPFGGLSHPVAKLVNVGFQTVYFCWAAKVFFEVSWWSAGWRSVVAVIAMSFFTVLVGVLAAAVVIALPMLLAD